VIRRLIVFAAASFAARPAAAFEIMKTAGGAPLHWVDLPVEYDVAFTLGDPAGERRSSAVRAAFDTWQRVASSSVAAEYRGGREAASIDDGRSTVDELREWDAAFGDANRAIAFTELRYDVNDGTIREADIHLNASRFRFAAGENESFDLESVVLHEAGHLFGLAHSCGDPGTEHPSCFSIEDDPPGERTRILEAVMAPGLAPEVLRRVLGEDDLAAIASLYPSSRPAPTSSIASAARPCPGDRLIVAGQIAEDARIALRYADGSEAELTAIERTSDRLELDPAALDLARGTVDLVVDEPSGARTTFIDLARAAPEGCVVEPPAIDEGCDCRSSGRGVPAMLALLFFFATRRGARR
jgi:hypothetical protein